jgi:glutamate-ammonia-ligase adenylyltransferase
LRALPQRSELDAQLEGLLARAPVYEAMLDTARRFAHEQIFRVGVQVIDGLAKPNDAGPAFAAIAETVIDGLLRRTEDELAETAGRVPGGAFAVIAMGKLGGREMTAGSDLDLIFVYDAPPDVEASDGPKPKPVSLYYARLAQRFIAALTVPTAEGGLYEVDMQLRPTGNKGPAAVSLESFTRYHATESWTWERLALTRARVIAGPEALAGKIGAVVRDTLCRPMPWAQLSADAGDMRRKVVENIPAKSAWDLKYARGGLMDIEFTAQVLQLRYAPDDPSVLDQGTLGTLKALALAGHLTEPDAAVLTAAAELQLALMQVLRIALDGALDPETATPGLKLLLTRAAGVGDFANLQRLLSDLQARAHAVFVRLVEG